MGNLKEIAKELRLYFEKLPSANYGGASSILYALFWMYTENNNLDNEAVKQQFSKLREYLNLPMEEYDEVFYIVSNLCVEHGKLAFQEGFRLAMALMQEVNKT